MKKWKEITSSYQFKLWFDTSKNEYSIWDKKEAIYFLSSDNETEALQLFDSFIKRLLADMKHATSSRFAYFFENNSYIILKAKATYIDDYISAKDKLALGKLIKVVEIPRGYHMCGCGNIVQGVNEHLLCDECQEIYGHKYDYEL